MSLEDAAQVRPQDPVRDWSPVVGLRVAHLGCGAHPHHEQLDRAVEGRANKGYTGVGVLSPVDADAMFRIVAATVDRVRASKTLGR